VVANETYLILRLLPDGVEFYLTHPETMRSVNEYYPYNNVQARVHPPDLDFLNLNPVNTKYGLDLYWTSQ
jgi:hypothetical protein